MRLRLLALVLLLVATAPVYAQSPVPPGAEAEQIASGFQFVEGPLWYDGGLLFSDINGNTVYRWTEEGGAEVFLQPSQRSNGLALDADGHVLLAQHEARQVARLEDDDTLTPLATHYEGDRLNSPNDLTLHPDGSVYFTDPPWGIQDWQRELDFEGVYRLAPDGALHLLVDSLHYPNGLAFSPDLTTLYVSTSDERTVVAYDLDGHMLSNGRLFATLTGGTPSDAADGMTVDAQGRLFVAGPIGVWIFAPDGTPLDTVAVPGQTTNVTLGVSDDRTLYITSGSGVYRIELTDTPSAVDDPGEQPDDASLLQPAYPNPATDGVTVAYDLTRPAHVDVRLLDVLGRTVQVMETGILPADRHTLHANVAGLPAGVYVVRLTTGGDVETRPLVVR